MRRSIIIALDLGTNTGFATCDLSGNITSGTASFKAGRFEGGGMPYLRFKRWLTDLKRALGAIDAIYFEKVRAHKGVDAAHKYGDSLPILPPGANITRYHTRAYLLEQLRSILPVKEMLLRNP